MGEEESRCRFCGGGWLLLLFGGGEGGRGRSVMVDGIELMKLL